MIRIPELLAPAGGLKQLEAAIENGADAVYLGGKLFNARQNAENFGGDELKRALEFAHIRGANVYIAFNTLIGDWEMKAALDYAGEVYEAGADALIVQDIGLAREVRRQLPDLPLHFSTQTTIYNLEGVRAAEHMGAKRVILARELSLKEVREIAENTNVELEMFVHGALCQCYSGQCLMSSMIGGRSGNRGQCAQPCRLPYTITKEDGGGRKALTGKGYYLSPKDLCTIEYLDQIIASGIRSLKIEGRMKSPEYVAVVTGIYRKYLDAYAEVGKPTPVDPADLKNLKQIYNRGGFSTGYLFSNPGRDLITPRRAKHWGTYLGKAVGQNERKRYVDILLEDTLSIGDGIEIVNDSLPGNLVTWMQKGGKKAVKGEKGETVTVGYIDGPIKKGDPVYKISDKELNEQAAGTFSRGYRKRVPVSGHFTALSGEALSLTLKDPEGNTVTATSNFVPEPAINKPLLEETARAQIEKTGATPFFMGECFFEIGENLSVSLSEINAIRRKAIDDLIEIRRDRYPDRKAASVCLEGTPDKRDSDKVKASVNTKRKSGSFNTSPLISVYLHRWITPADVKHILADRVYLPFLPRYEKEQISTIQSIKDQGLQVYISVPPVTRGEADNTLRRQAKSLGDMGIDGLLAGNISHLELLSASGLPMTGDYSLNIYNSRSVKAAAELGLKGVTLSPELTLSQMKSIDSFGMELEAAVYGRIPVMISEHCPIGSQICHRPDSRKCGLCQSGRYYLKDRTGAEFPVTGDPSSCRTAILNKDNLYVPESVHALWSSGITSFRLYFNDEAPEEMAKLIERFRRG